MNFSMALRTFSWMVTFSPKTDPFKMRKNLLVFDFERIKDYEENQVYRTADSLRFAAG